jgi:hypothetical protein
MRSGVSGIGTCGINTSPELVLPPQTAAAAHPGSLGVNIAKEVLDSVLASAFMDSSAGHVS